MATSWAAWPPAWSAIASMVAAYRVAANRIRRITASIRAICIRSHVDPCSSLSIRIIRLSFSTYPATLASRWSYSCRRKMCRQHFKVCPIIYITLFIFTHPSSIPADVQHHGSLFTLFLHSPLTALCYICNVGDVPIHHWERCQTYVDRFITEASRLVTRCRIDEIEQGIGFIGELRKGGGEEEVIKIILNSILASLFADSSYVQFFGDDFLRTLILRFVFCDVVLRLHRGFRGRHMRPRCEPQLPANELLEHPSLSHIIFQLASALDVRGHFSEGPECDWWLFLAVVLVLVIIFYMRQQLMQLVSDRQISLMHYVYNTFPAALMATWRWTWSGS